jgi:hypothetical protein
MANDSYDIIVWHGGNFEAAKSDRDIITQTVPGATVDNAVLVPSEAFHEALTDRFTCRGGVCTVLEPSEKSLVSLTAEKVHLVNRLGKVIDAIVAKKQFCQNNPNSPECRVEHTP